MDCLSCEEVVLEMLVLIFIQVTNGLWSDSEHGCLTTIFETFGKDLGHKLRNR